MKENIIGVEMKVNLTEEQIHSDMKKLRKMFKHFQTMPDEDIQPIDKEFYGKLETAGHIALKYKFDHKAVEDFYKLKLWLEMYDQVFGGKLMNKLYLVERLVVEYQYIVADSEDKAIQDALDCGEWDRETISQGDELFYGVRAEFKGET